MKEGFNFSSLGVYQFNNKDIHVDVDSFSGLACSLRASWIVWICCETADNIRSSRRLNSSKQPHAPTWHSPTNIRPIACKLACIVTVNPSYSLCFPDQVRHVIKITPRRSFSVSLNKHKHFLSLSLSLSLSPFYQPFSRWTWVAGVYWSKGWWRWR